jgi:hypothetical protein
MQAMLVGQLWASSVVMAWLRSDLSTIRDHGDPTGGLKNQDLASSFVNEVIVCYMTRLTRPSGELPLESSTVSVVRVPIQTDSTPL